MNSILKNRKEILKIERILVSRTDKIGDLVLSIPSFFMLRKMYPKSKIGVLVRNYNYDVVKNLPYIDEVIKIDDYKERELIEKIINFNATKFIALFSNSFIAKLARKSRAETRIGPYSKLSSFFSYNKGVYQKRSKSIKNEAEYNLDLIKSMDLDLFKKNYEINTKLYYRNEHKLFVKKFLEENRIQNFIIIHAFNGGSAKNLTYIQYMELAKKILDDNSKLQIIFTAAKPDGIRCNEIIKKINNKRAISFINEGSILNLAALIDKCELFLGTSTGPIHIAGSLGKKIIGIYPIKKTQSPVRWGVFGNSNVQYILPEGNTEEDYSTKEFLSYGEKEEKQMREIIKKWF